MNTNDKNTINQPTTKKAPTLQIIQMFEVPYHQSIKAVPLIPNHYNEISV